MRLVWRVDAFETSGSDRPSFGDSDALLAVSFLASFDNRLVSLAGEPAFCVVFCNVDVRSYFLVVSSIFSCSVSLK